MNRHKGFTLVEAMVGLVILAIAITGSLSFFIFQSRSGFVSSRLKTTDEELFFTRTLITRDVCQAGFGVATHPELAVYVADGGTGTGDQLYLNYTGHLTMEESSQVKSASLMAALKQNSVYYESGDNFQGYLRVKTAGVTALTLSAIPKIGTTTKFPDIAAFITNAAGLMGATDVNVNSSTGTDGPLVGTQNWTFPLASNITGSASAPTFAAPAVSYKLVKAPISGGITGIGGSVTQEIVGGLWRNRGAETSPFGSPLFGGTPYLDVTDFQVRCQFSDGSWAATNTSGATLRLVEITISYRTRGRNKFWTSVQTHVITGSPRTIAIQP
jgi:prepilin-type N-terminal cleavage/methylation domain-containing protein